MLHSVDLKHGSGVVAMVVPVLDESDKVGVQVKGVLLRVNYNNSFLRGGVHVW